MSKLWMIFGGVATLVMSALPAAAEGSDRDWIERTFTSRSERSELRSNEKRTASKREAREELGERRVSTKSKAATRIARVNDNDDDGSRPQRKSASKPRPRESLSSGGGETGVASYYWEPQALASGGRFNPNAMTAAHKTLPFGTRVRVTHLGNGNSVEVTINDRGPYISGRIIDLSKRAAQDIGMTGSGVARVKVAVLGRN